MEEAGNRLAISPGMPLPSSLTAAASLPTGERVTMRPMRSDDSIPFGAYLDSLSADTRSRYGPHPFNQETADAICATLDPSDILRMVATIPHNGEERVIAYILLKLGIHEDDGRRYKELGIPLAPDTDVTLAPSVADDYQNQGLGSLMMRHIIGIASRLGRQRIVLWGGVQATNARAIHFYEKWGFHKVGEFYTDKNNHDMILDLR